MSRYYALTPVERYCQDCNGYGRRLGRLDEPQFLGELCARCQGIGREFIEGGPTFGCKIALSKTKPGQIVTLGNGDRGRVIRHCHRGTPTTEIALIDPMFDDESTETTTYPSETGVASMSASSWFADPSGGSRGKEDHLDPLQGRKAP